MPKSVTRWKNEDESIIDPTVQEALLPFIIDELTFHVGKGIVGPAGGVPFGQYECHRTWATIELAYNWLETIERIEAQLGVKCVYKAVIE
jgi:hypothetical protein